MYPAFGPLTPQTEHTHVYAHTHHMHTYFYVHILLLFMVFLKRTWPSSISAVTLWYQQGVFLCLSLPDRLRPGHNKSQALCPQHQKCHLSREAAQDMFIEWVNFDLTQISPILWPNGRCQHPHSVLDRWRLHVGGTGRRGATPLTEQI